MTFTPNTRVRPLAFFVWMALAAPAALLPQAAQAQSAPQQYDLAEGPLDATLTAIARRSGRVLSFSPELVRGQTAPAIQGSMDAESALRLALSRTKLQLLVTAGGAMTIERMPETGVPVLGTILAVGNGKVITREMLEHMPNKSGSIEGALGMMTEVQTATNAERSLQGGEIKPPQISIAGGKPYENRYVINGLGNNNYVAPPRVTSNTVVANQPSYLDNFTKNADPAGMAQSYNLSTDLLENIELQDSRISVRHSGFTGGVVQADTRKPDLSRFGGRIWYGESRSKWDNIFFDERQLRGAEFDESWDALRQPDYTRKSGGVMLNIPLNERFGTIISYDRKESRIPLLYTPNTNTGAATKKDQKRTSETLFATLGGRTASGLDVSLTGVYYKYDGYYFASQAINSGFSQEQETYDLALNLSKEFAIGKASARVKYGEMNSTRDIHSNINYEWMNYGDKNWGGSNPLSVDGTFSAGSMDFKQRTIATALDFEFNPVQLGDTRHRVAVGLNSETVLGSMNSDGYTAYKLAQLWAGGPLDPGQDGVGYNWDRTGGALSDQYFRAKYMMDPASRKARAQSWSLWLEDSITFSDFLLRPGVRLDYDTQFRNFNVAPRVAGEWNVMGRDVAVLKAGWGRYYGGPNLYHSLFKSTGGQGTWLRNGAPGPDGLPSWQRLVNTSSGNNYDASKLKTPYSDEISLGLDLKLAGGFAVDYNFIHRLGRDGIRERMIQNPNGTGTTYSATNDGETKYTGHTLSLSNNYFDNHYFRLSATWSDNKTNYSDYKSYSGSYQDVGMKRDRTRIIYNGTLMDASKVDASQFNRPLQIVGFWQGRFWDRVDLSTTVTWTASSPILVKNGTWHWVDSNQWQVEAWDKKKLPSRFVVDMSLGVDIFRHNNTSLRATLDVFNVLNSKNKNGMGAYTSGGRTYYYDFFGPGRSFMGNVEYRF